MAYQKVTAINNAGALVDALKAFVQTNAPSLTYAGNCGSGNTRPSFSNAKGYFFNFDFTDKYIATTISKAKPAADIQAGAIAAPLSPLYGAIKSTIAVSNNFEYPLIACSFFTDGKLVVMVLETVAGVFRHHAFGNLSTYGDFDGGEFAGGTATLLNRKVILGDSSSSSAYPFDGGELVHPFITGYARTNTYDYGNNGTPDPNYMLGVQYRSHMVRYKDEWLVTTATSRSVGDYETTYNLRIFDYVGIFGVPPNTYNGRVQLAPLVWNKYYEYASEPTTKKVTVPLFHTDFVAYTSIDTFQVEEVLNNEWVLFPLTTKIETFPKGTITKNFAIAYKK